MNEERFNPDHKAVIDRVLLAIPGVQGGKAFGYPAYKVGGKVFAFVGGSGMAIKLPAPRAQELMSSNADVKPFQPAEGITWKEWVSINCADSAAYERYEPLFIESIEFVSGA